MSPASSDGAALGTSSLHWSDLFLASGAVININNGDVTVTHSSNALAFAGASSGYLFDAAVAITGALSASGNFTINTDKLSVTAASGNTSIAGTLNVTGAGTFSAAVSVGTTLSSGGSFTVNADKFTVNGPTGNTTVAGTLAVTGALSANASGGITGRNTVKAFGRVVSGTLQANSFNVNVVTDGGAFHTIDLSIVLANTNYSVLITNGADTDTVVSYSNLATSSFRVECGDASDPVSYSFMVLSNE